AYSNKEKKIEESAARVKEILTKASEENRSLTQSEADEINRIKTEMLNTAVNVMSESEAEQAAIMERMRANATNLSAKQAADVVKNSIKQRDETVKSANEEYNERLKLAAQLRAEGG
ncbi:hypothetical protein, partial [Streptobacillus moniliformis]